MAIPWHPAAEIEGWGQGRLEQAVMAQQFLLTWVRLPSVSCQDVGSDNSDPGLPKLIVLLELVGSPLLLQRASADKPARGRQREEKT